jgi:hypothetical protein
MNGPLADKELIWHTREFVEKLDDFLRARDDRSREEHPISHRRRKERVDARWAFAKSWPYSASLRRSSSCGSGARTPLTMLARPETATWVRGGPCAHCFWRAVLRARAVRARRDGSKAGVQVLPMRSGEVPVQITAEGEVGRLDWQPELDWDRIAQTVRWYRDAR